MALAWWVVIPGRYRGLEQLSERALRPIPAADDTALRLVFSGATLHHTVALNAGKSITPRGTHR